MGKFHFFRIFFPGIITCKTPMLSLYKFIIYMFFIDGHDVSKEPKRPRLDPSANILEQLMTPMLDSQNAPKQEGPLEVVDKDGDTTIIHIPDPGQECKVNMSFDLLSCCCSQLQSIINI